MEVRPTELPPDKGHRSVQEISEDLSACYLASSMCTVVGVGVGTALSVQRKSAKYLALGGLAGTMADAAYSFGYMCRDLQLEYSVARSQAYKMSKEEERKRALEISARARGETPNVKGSEKS